MTFPDVVTVFEKTYIPKVTISRHRFAWDDENPDYGYKCRTQMDGWDKPDNPPAVIRFYPLMREGAGDFRVNLQTPYDWEPAIIAMNGGDSEAIRRFDYWKNPNTAQFNTTGWAKMAYVGMCGNEIEILERIGDWYRFKTLKQSDVFRVAGWTIANNPKFIHRFTCVTWDTQTKTTKRILSTGTARGDVFYPLVTVEGYAYIPARHVVRVS
jgi:hypothetical protein